MKIAVQSVTLIAALPHSRTRDLVKAAATGQLQQLEDLISLDLDLLEKVYLLVNSRDDLQNKFALCLFEGYTVFAMV